MGGSPYQPIAPGRPSLFMRVLQSWWVLLAAAPFGWLAFAAFVYAGARARRPAWVVTGVVYFLVIWFATAVAVVADPPEGVTQAAGLALLVGWPVAFIHAVVLVPSYLRALERRSPTAPPPAPVPPPAPLAPSPVQPPAPVPAREPMEVPGWTRGWAGGRVRFWAVVIFNVLLILGGFLFLLSDVGVAAVMLLFGLGTAFTLPLYATWRRRGSIAAATVPDAPGRMGLYFRYSSGKHRANVIGLSLMALACAAFTVVVPELQARVGGVLGAGVLGMNAIRMLARPGTVPYVALIQEGVVARVGPSSWFVPWAAITNVAAVEIRMRSAREQFVGVAVADRNLVEISRTGRGLMRLNRWLAADLSYTTRGLDVDPALLLYAMRFYWGHPESRDELSTQAAVDRVNRLDLFDGSSGGTSGTSSS